VDEECRANASVVARAAPALLRHSWEVSQNLFQALLIDPVVQNTQDTEPTGIRAVLHG